MDTFGVNLEGQRGEAWPEVAMGIQVGESSHGEGYLIIGGELAVDPPGLLDPKSWPVPNYPVGGSAAELTAWLASATKTKLTLRRPSAGTLATVLGYIVTPIGPVAAAPARPATVYGHLPFTSTTTGSDKFYRWEPWPTSRKFKNDLMAGPIIDDDTFASPAKELGMILSGFAAVARNALPSLFPATTRYEIEPLAGEAFQCGPSVPLYGMSGGGVEVMFPKGTKLHRMPTSTIIDAL